MDETSPNVNSFGCEDVAKRFGTHAVLSGVSVSINVGEIVSISGPSGGGKTTLLRILAGLDTPDMGVVYGGKSRMEYCQTAPRGTGSQLRHPELCMVFQRLFLWPHLRNLDNILLGARGLREDDPWLLELATRLGVADVLGQFPNESSIGQQQRVALIRALVLKPRFLVVDEVTSALDRAMTKTLATLLGEYAEAGNAVLLSTHDLWFASAVAGRGYLLEAGKLMEK